MQKPPNDATNHPSVQLYNLQQQDTALLVCSLFAADSSELARNRAYDLLVSKIEKSTIPASLAAIFEKLFTNQDSAVLKLGIELLIQIQASEDIENNVIISICKKRPDLIGEVLGACLCYPLPIIKVQFGEGLRWILANGQRESSHQLLILELAHRALLQSAGDDRIFWWDIFFTVFSTESPSFGNQVQDFALVKIEELTVTVVSRGGDELEDDEWEVVVHFLNSRLVYFWMHLKLFDRSTFRIMFASLQTRKKIMNILLLKTLVVSLSVLLLDLVANEKLQILLVRVCKEYSERVPGDSWIQLAVLPVLSCLAADSMIGVDEGLLQLLQDLEFLNCGDRVSSIASTLIHSPPRNFNHHYASLLELCMYDPPPFNVPTVFPSVKTLLLAYTIFSNSENTDLVRKSLQNITREVRSQDLLTFLYFYIYLINKRKVDTSLILKEFIPSLTGANDAFITSSSLKLILALLKGGNGTRILDATCFQALLNILKHQRRVFPHVKKYLANWMNLFKNSRGAGRQKTELEKKKEDELELIVTESIRSLCIEDPHNWGKELLPIIISLLKISDRPDFGATRAPSFEGTRNLIAAFNACIEGEVAAPLTAWNVLFKAYYESISDNSYPIIPASLCDFFALVALKTDADSEKEVSFRLNILNKYLAPLLSHKDVLVREHAFRALTFFPFEDASPLIPPPADLIAQLEKNEIPKTAITEFLRKKIEAEVADMPRPVFKGLAVQSGVKNSSKNEAISTHKREDEADVSKMHTLAKSVTESWVSGHKNRGGLAPAAMFYPFLDSPEAFRNLCALGMRDISTTLSSPLQALDVRQGWQEFCTHTLNFVFQTYSADASEDKMLAMMSEFVEKEVLYLVQLSKSSTIPSTVAAAITIATSLVTVSSSLHFLPSSETVSILLVTLKSKLDGGKEVATAVILSLVDLLEILNSNQESEEVLALVWSRCLSPNLTTDDFLFSFCASKIIFHQMSLSNTQRAGVFLDEFLARFFDACDRGWSSIGAAFGFSSILASPIVDLSDWMDEKKLEKIINYSFNFLADCLKNNSLEGSDCNALVLSAGWKFSSFTCAQVFEILSNVFEIAKENENSIHYSCLVRVQVLLYNSVEIFIGVLECIKKGASVSMMINRFDALRVLLGRDFGGQQQPLLLKENIWNVLNVCKEILMNHTSPVIVRASGWAFGLSMASLSTILNGSSTMNKSTDPRDYRRLNADTSYLKATFDALIAPMKAETSIYLFKNVFLGVKCILPPVDWNEALSYLKIRGLGELECLQFVSYQASERGSKCLVIFLLDHVQRLLPRCHKDPILSRTIYSDSVFGKLLDLAGVGPSKSSGSSISSLSLQNIIVSALQTLSSNKQDQSIINLLYIIQKSISDSNPSADLKRLLWSWILDHERSILSFSDFEIVRLVLLSLKDAPGILNDVLSFAREKESPFSLVCLANFALLSPSDYLNEFLNKSLLLATDSTFVERATEVTFILNWTISSLTCNGAEEKLAIVSKVLDLNIISLDNPITNLSQFTWLFLVLPTIWTLQLKCNLEIRAQRDWRIMQNQACVCLVELLHEADSSSKYWNQVRSRLIQLEKGYFVTLSQKHNAKN